jgi:hypothetical protein
MPVPKPLNTNNQEIGAIESQKGAGLCAPGSDNK